MNTQHIKTQLVKNNHLSSGLSADWLKLTSLKTPVIGHERSLISWHLRDHHVKELAQ